MISYDEFNEFCKSLPQTTYVVQWGGAHVWKVGDKVFAIGGWNKGNNSGITFKCSEISYEMLKEQPGLRPAPYLASRGMKWIQMHDEPGLTKDELFSYIEESYHLVIKKLTKKKRKELGLEKEA
ncbi:MmcQ/YjbR family DNA-binding protein [Hyphomicrobiales bacterium 4NK60-0047b]